MANVRSVLRQFPFTSVGLGLLISTSSVLVSIHAAIASNGDVQQPKLSAGLGTVNLPSHSSDRDLASQRLSSLPGPSKTRGEATTGQPILLSQLSDATLNSKDSESKDSESLGSAAPPLMQKLTPLSQLSEPKTTGNSQNSAAGQATSVSQLSDVKPTDWAFQALQSLVERYGVIVGYPDSTYRGNRAITRYEFAAGLNAALNRVNELLAAGTTDLVRKEDLATLQRLQEEFAAELATLRGRVAALEVRDATLQQQQFSTTVKLSGEAIFVAGGILSGDNASGQQAPQTITFQDRPRLVFGASFTGKDSLRLILTAENITQLGYWVSTTPAKTPKGTPTNTFTGVLRTYDGLLADTQAPRYISNGLYLTTATYRFPVGNSTTVNVFAQSEGVFALGLSSVANPYFESGGGNNSISRFGRRNAVYDYGDSGPGAAILQKIGQQLELGIAYTSINGDTITAGANNAPAGFLKGRYVAAAQATYYSVDRKFRAVFTFTNTYSPPGVFFGPQIGSNLANSTEGTGAAGNSYGLGAFYQISPKIAINGWAGYTQLHYFKFGDGESWNWAVEVAFPDLLKKGNLGGILVGMEPKVTQLDKTVNLGNGFGVADRDTSLHIEAFYQYRVNDHIEITPGFVWITAPNFDARNADDFIGLVRARFLY